ncbi:hypothetical protein BN996_02390 [Haloferax massiliensis]|uniref:Uncharacterized protein n=2 Tax=Haloferax massiliensis TaxID=1476858 RepID=A0A0D6JTK6_9EURY|nr:hypothetical protein BN996_02390 [Haloferax massiliensis]
MHESDHYAVSWFHTEDYDFVNSCTDPSSLIGLLSEQVCMRPEFQQRRRDAATETAQATRDASPPELPTLDGGCHRLVVEDEPRPVQILQALVLDHALTTGGDVLWLDAATHANAASLTRLSPSRRLLDRIHVARAFTPYQHAELATTLRSTVAEEDINPSLVVCPGLDALYDTDEVSNSVGKQLLSRALAAIKRVAREVDASLLATHLGRPETNPYAEIVARAVPSTLYCEQTQFGPRFRGTDFETLVYPDATGMQTTLAFWRTVLAHRATASDMAVEPATPSGVMVDGTQ